MVINHWCAKVKNKIGNRTRIHTFLIAPSDLSPMLVTHIDSETKTKAKRNYNLSHCLTRTEGSEENKMEMKKKKNSNTNEKHFLINHPIYWKCFAC